MGESPIAARQGIAMVTMSRILMAAPGMVLIPMFMDRLEKKGVLARSNLMFSWHWQRAVTDVGDVSKFFRNLYSS